MSKQSDLALQHQALRIALGHRVTARVLRIWRGADVSRLDQSWDALAPVMVAQLTAAQVTAARQSAPFLNAIDRSYGFDAERAVLVPEAFGGVTLDGREVGPAMFSAVTETKRLIGGGMDAGRAFEAGAAFLSVIANSALQDMGRQADNTLATGKGYTRYIRVVSPGACSRCAILAGSGSYRTAFPRHPRCKCTTCPIVTVDGKVSDDIPDGFFPSPEDYFESLSKVEQDKVFTKSGAFAIRNGAEPIKVVNARRGAKGIGYSGHFNVSRVGESNRLQRVTIGRKADGSPLQVFATTESTTARGDWGREQLRLNDQFAKEGRYRRTSQIRLMPEQIQIMAGDDPVRARELLKRYGYLT